MNKTQHNIQNNIKINIWDNVAYNIGHNVGFNIESNNNVYMYDKIGMDICYSIWCGGLGNNRVHIGQIRVNLFKYLNPSIQTINLIQSQIKQQAYE